MADGLLKDVELASRLASEEAEAVVADYLTLQGATPRLFTDEAFHPFSSLTDAADAAAAAVASGGAGGEATAAAAGAGAGDSVPAGVAGSLSWLRPSEFLAPRRRSDAGAAEPAADTAAAGAAAAGAAAAPADASPEPCLFRDGTCDPGDVIEGALGDCFFLAAVSVLAQQPGRIRRLFVNQAATPAGCYACRFFSNNTWRTVVVDDRIPCKSRRPAFGHCPTPEVLWVPLLEKAYAKLYGSYDAICGGSVSEALRDLTGAAVRDVNLEDTAAKGGLDELWSKLRTDHAAGHLIGTAFVNPPGVKPRASKLKGVLPNHAYGVMEVRAVDKHRLVRVRNPWGKCEWTGAWSDASPLWTPAMRAKVGSTAPPPPSAEADADDGEFWMAFDDFVGVFNRVYVCMCGREDSATSVGPPESAAAAVVAPAATAAAVAADGTSTVAEAEGTVDVTIRGEFTAETAGGHSGLSTWRRNPHFVLHVSRPCVAFVTLAQPDRRAAAKTKGDLTYPQLGFSIVRMKRALPPTEPDVAAPEAGAAAAAAGGVTSIAGAALASCPDPRLVTGEYEKVLQTSYWNKRETGSDVVLEPTTPDRPYLLVPSTYYAGVRTPFWLSVRAQPRPVAGAAAGAAAASAAAPAAAGPALRFESMRWGVHFPFTATARSEWSADGKTAGGQANSATFHANPQFLLQFDAANPRVVVFLAQEARSKGGKAARGGGGGGAAAAASRAAHTAERPGGLAASYLVRDPASGEAAPYHGMGFYAIAACGQVTKKTNVAGLAFLDKFAFTNAAEVARQLTLPERLANGARPPVLIVPCTHKPRAAARFEITVMSTHPVRIEPASAETAGAVKALYKAHREAEAADGGTPRSAGAPLSARSSPGAATSPMASPPQHGRRRSTGASPSGAGRGGAKGAAAGGVASGVAAGGRGRRSSGARSGAAASTGSPPTHGSAGTRGGKAGRGRGRGKRAQPFGASVGGAGAGGAGAASGVSFEKAQSTTSGMADMYAGLV